MSTTAKPQPSAEAERLLEVLRQAVSHTLEKKRRLGHYAVVWQDGKPVMIGDDAPGGQQHSR